MKKNLIIIAAFCFISNIGTINAQDINAKIIELGEVYNRYKYLEHIPKSESEVIDSNSNSELQKTVDFIVQATSRNNKLMEPEYLSLPDDSTLKYISIVKAVSDNIKYKNFENNKVLVDSLVKSQTTRYEEIDAYYEILFTSVGNKDKSGKYTKYDFTLEKYNLKDETEKGIFFLKCMDKCGQAIYDYIHVDKPANSKMAYRCIQKFPTFNGQPYYRYTSFSFPDFKIYVSKKDGLRSYKTFYMTKYYNTLLNHLICLNKQIGTGNEEKNLCLYSILKDKSLYVYSEKNAVLSNMFYPDLSIVY